VDVEMNSGNGVCFDLIGKENLSDITEPDQRSRSVSG